MAVTVFVLICMELLSNWQHNLINAELTTCDDVVCHNDGYCVAIPSSDPVRYHCQCVGNYYGEDCRLYNTSAIPEY